ncbi:hypothetical protein D9M71_788810 [compost metagenome]
MSYKCGESEDCCDIDRGPMIYLLTKLFTGYKANSWKEAYASCHEADPCRGNAV